MSHHSHHVSGFLSAAVGIAPEAMQLIDGDITHYRKRIADSSVQYAADLATEDFDRFRQDPDCRDSEKRVFLIGLMNALSELIHSTGEQATFARLEELCPKIAGRIEKIYTKLDPELHAPRTIAGLQPIKQLGGGGHGQVFLAEDRFNQKHAVKLALKDTPESSLLAHESKIYDQLRSLPDDLQLRIPKYAELDGDKLHDVLIMELLPGVNLESRLKTNPLEWNEVRSLSLPLLDLVSGIHRLGLLHLDLKPANVVLRTSQKSIWDRNQIDPVLIDFGLSVQLSEGNQPVASPRAIGGTLAFASPEQIANDEVGYQSDVYSLGCLLGYALTKTLPDQRSKFRTRLEEVAAEEPKSQTFIAAILKSIDPDPSKRHADVDAFRKALWPSQTPQAVRRRRTYKLSAMFVTIAALLLGVISLAIGDDSGPPTWIDRLAGEHDVRLADYGPGEFRFVPDFVQAEQENYYKSGLIYVEANPALAPFLKALEIRIGEGAWTGPMSVSDTGAEYPLNSDDVVDGQVVDLRFDSLPGPGTGKVYGQTISVNFDFIAIRDQQLSEWRASRRQLDESLGTIGYAFQYKDGWRATDYLLDQAWDIEDVILYEQPSRDSYPVSLNDLYLKSGAYTMRSDSRDGLATLCDCMPDEFRNSVQLNYAIQYRGDPPFWEEEFWEKSKLHTIDRAIWTGESPRIMQGDQETFLPEHIGERNEIAAAMIKGRSPSDWEFTEDFVNTDASLVAEIYFTTSVFGEDDQPRYRLAEPKENPTIPSHWKGPRTFSLRGNYDVTCFFVRVVFLDGSSSDFIRHRLSHDTEYPDQRRWVVVTYDAPEKIKQDLDIGEQLRYLKGRELQRINYGK